MKPRKTSLFARSIQDPRFVCFQCSSVAFDLGNWKDSKELILMLLGMIEFLIDQKTYMKNLFAVSID